MRTHTVRCPTFRLAAILKSNPWDNCDIISRSLRSASRSRLYVYAVAREFVRVARPQFSLASVTLSLPVREKGCACAEQSLSLAATERSTMVFTSGWAWPAKRAVQMNGKIISFRQKFSKALWCCVFNFPSSFVGIAAGVPSRARPHCRFGLPQ